MYDKKNQFQWRHRHYIHDFLPFSWSLTHHIFKYRSLWQPKSSCCYHSDLLTPNTQMPKRWNILRTILNKWLFLNTHLKKLSGCAVLEFIFFKQSCNALASSPLAILPHMCGDSWVSQVNRPRGNFRCSLVPTYKHGVHGAEGCRLVYGMSCHVIFCICLSAFGW